MEAEKIKIYVTKRIAEILEKDAETFEFIKKDGITPNKNAFLTTLIINYWEIFRDRQNKFNNIVKDAILSNISLSSEKVEQLSYDIANKINRESASDLLENFNQLVSLKPTKESKHIIDYIESYLLEGNSLSEYFRNMFFSYTQLPQDMREKIIFKTQYNTISDAIKNGNKIFITTRSDKGSKLEIAPYAFSRSKEEMHIYLLYEIAHFCRSIKLSKINSVVILNSKSSFNKKVIDLFAKMNTYGPQFFYNFDEQDVVIKLTKRGIQLFHKMYVHRPIPYSIDKDIYTFKCSHTQIIQYFSRFGGDVEILSPKSIHEAIYKFHNSYLNKFKNWNKDNIIKKGTLS